jgi:hypothetical protein
MPAVPYFAFASPTFLAQLVQTGSFCEEKELEIDGYPEYEEHINTLPQADQDKVEALAKKIVAAQTDRPVVRVNIYGHADAALRIQDPTARRKKEEEVSWNRAQAASGHLLGKIQEQPPNGESIATHLHIVAKGMGSSQRRFIPTPDHPLTEAEMRKNRRVEFYLVRRCLPPPEPKPQPKPQPEPPKEPGRKWRMQIKSGLLTTVLTPTDISPSHLFLRLEITDLDREQTAVFSVQAVGTGLPSATFPPSLAPIQSAQVTAGSPTDFETGKAVTLGDFAGDVDIGQDAGASVHTQSKGGNFNFMTFQNLADRGVPTHPSVVSAGAGSGSLSLPSANGPATFHGKMALVSGPAPVQ